jgi:hypothetical protein
MRLRDAAAALRMRAEIDEPPHVITGLVPVIAILWSVEPHRIGMAGTTLTVTRTCHPRRSAGPGRGSIALRV